MWAKQRSYCAARGRRLLRKNRNARNSAKSPPMRTTTITRTTTTTSPKKSPLLKKSPKRKSPKKNRSIGRLRIGHTRGMAIKLKPNTLVTKTKRKRKKSPTSRIAVNANTMRRSRRIENTRESINQVINPV
ncbi:unnamed protein product, partial [Medioppia subpectinata]